MMRPLSRRPRAVQVFRLAAACTALFAIDCGPKHVAGPAAPTPAPAASTAMHAIIPRPVDASVDPAVHFTITDQTTIVVDPGNEPARRIGSLLSDLVGSAVKRPLQVVSPGGEPAPNTIALATHAGNAALGPEGYELTVSADRVRIVANEPAGLFYGVQTLRQLMPASIEYRAALARPVPIPGAHIIDHPRFGWRGAMLDVARHFFGVRDVEHYIDLISLYKMNHLHLHLTDDQGWRIEITSWPNLTEHGGRTAVWGGPGGYYTQQDYAEIVRYAADRFVTIVPEIEMPSHSNAALASYPELNCDGKAPPLYTGIEVGFSSFCVDKDVTYTFLADVMKELAAMTPGPYIHVGGDEVKTLTPAQYKQFMERAQAIVAATGKQVIGWDEMSHIDRLPTTVVQHWRPAFTGDTSDMKLVLSPAQKILSRHEVRPLHADRARLGRAHRGPRGLRLGADHRRERPRIVHRRRRSADLVRDAADDG